MPTPVMVTSEPGTMSAATARNAAEDGSPGTKTRVPRSSGWPVTVIARAPALSSAMRNVAPKARSISSV